MSRINDTDSRKEIGVGDITEGQLLRSPPPWRVGECHESMAKITDADGMELCIIKGSGHMFGRVEPDALALLLVSALNGHLLPIYEKLVEQKRLEEKFHVLPRP